VTPAQRKIYGKIQAMALSNKNRQALLGIKEVHLGWKETIGSSLWEVYGILNGLLSAILWNGIALIMGCGMLYAKIKWGN
jgi:hypothetical protein